MTGESNDDDSYLDALDERLLAAAGAGQSFAGFVREASGAFPTLVLERLRARSIEFETAEERLAEQPSPELHPLDFEWYFTPGCAEKFAATLPDLPGPLACLGAPTVAAASARAGRRVVLVDQSPLISRRLPGLEDLLTLRRHDLHRPLAEEHRFGTVFFDPPW